MIRAAAILGCLLALANGISAQTFRSGVQGVSVHVSVRHRNAPVGGLLATDFTLTDNGVPQAVTAVSLDTSPIDITLLLDTSGSMAGAAIEALRNDVRAIGTLLRGDDRLRVVTFATRATEALPMQPWREITRNIHLTTSGATAFFNGVIAALLHPSEAGRPHVVVAISDGADNMSLLDGGDVRALAERSDAVLHVVQRRPGWRVRGSPTVVRWGWVPFSGFAGLQDMRAAAETTGGRLVPETVDRPLPEVVKRTLEDFRTGYVLWFTPAGVEKTGWHELAVRVKGRRYDVSARRGYFGG